MVRKQVYLDEAQDRALKRHARELGVSEAEVVRRALDAVLQPAFAGSPLRGDLERLHALLREMDERTAGHGFPADYRFHRQRLHEDE